MTIDVTLSAGADDVVACGADRNGTPGAARLVFGLNRRPGTVAVEHPVPLELLVPLLQGALDLIAMCSDDLTAVASGVADAVAALEEATGDGPVYPDDVEVNRRAALADEYRVLTVGESPLIPSGSVRAVRGDDARVDRIPWSVAWFRTEADQGVGVATDRPLDLVHALVTAAAQVSDDANHSSLPLSPDDRDALTALTEPLIEIATAVARARELTESPQHDTMKS